MPDVETPRQLARAHWRRLENIRRRLVGVLSAEYVRSEFAPDVDEIVPLVLAGQRAAVTATDAGLSLAAGLATGTSTRPMGINPEPLIGAAARNGTLLESVYSRPAVVAREAPTRALSFVEGLIRTDMQLASTAASRAFTFAERRVLGYRRVVNPVAETCGLCVVASTRVYGKAELMPIHIHCGCSVAPIYGETPLEGSTVDNDRLQAVYERSLGDQETIKRMRFEPGELPASDFPEGAFSNLNVATAWDSELGPTLTGANHGTSFATT